MAIDNQRLRAMLVNDELTGLASRRGFFEQAEARLRAGGRD